MDVTATDPAGTEILPHTPVVSIANTVYLGDDEGSRCSDSTLDVVQEQYGKRVVYCFRITNNGNSALQDIVVSDPVLGYTSPVLGLLNASKSMLVWTTGTITGNLSNMAMVTASPCLPDGSAIDQPAVTAQDASAIVQLSPESAINVENTVTVAVRAGLDNTACGSVNETFVQDYVLTPVLYCFSVANVGKSSLKDVNVVNTDFGFDQTIPLMAPGETKVFKQFGVIESSLTNKVTATGKPALVDGTVIPNAAVVTDDDTSSVAHVAYQPQVSVENSVYLGSGDNCRQCETSAAREYVEGVFGTAVTFCFKVVNMGDTPLTNIRIVNADLGYTQTIAATTLAKKGDSTVVSVERTIVNDASNIVVVTAQPNVDRLNLADVTSSDPSRAGKLAVTPSITIDHKVYAGANDGGAQCNNASDAVEGMFATSLVYCVTITNYGDTALANVTITNDKISCQLATIALLPKGGVTTVSCPGQISSDVVNTAVAVGIPVTDLGLKIPDCGFVTSQDSVTVKRLQLEAKVQIIATGYLGRNNGAFCGLDITPESADKVTAYYETNTTCCFTVINTGT
jgi:hypothetical protein